jgi:hypothetical protein
MAEALLKLERGTTHETRLQDDTAVSHFASGGAAQPPMRMGEKCCWQTGHGPKGGEILWLVPHVLQLRVRHDVPLVRPLLLLMRVSRQRQYGVLPLLPDLPLLVGCQELVTLPADGQLLCQIP